MEDNQTSSQVTLNEMHQYAANLFVGGKNAYEVKEALQQRGLNEQGADSIVDAIEQQYKLAKRARAKKEMLYGGLWCVGGTALTLAHIGFIFWGAIIFGGIQFFRGLSNLNQS